MNQQSDSHSPPSIRDIYHLFRAAVGRLCSVQSQWLQRVICSHAHGVLVPLPRVGLVSPALESGFLTSGPGKSSWESSILNHFKVSRSNCEETQHYPHFNFHKRFGPKAWKNKTAWKILGQKDFNSFWIKKK